MESYDVVIVGAGLAGACAAAYLSDGADVLVLDAGRPGQGASAASAGLVNPFTGVRARPAWRMEAALEALHDVLDRYSARATFRAGIVLRPAADEKQARRFRDVAETHPGRTTWLPARAVHERYPHVRAGVGALSIEGGGAVDVPALVDRLVEAAAGNGAVVRAKSRVTGWHEDGARAYVDVRSPESRVRYAADHVILAMGDGYVHFDELASLQLHRIKGQTVRVAHPHPGSAIPNLAGRGFVVDGGGTLVLGSTYEHDFSDVHPSPEATRIVVDKTSRMLPALEEARVLDARAGVRVTVPRVRRPVLGPLPGRRRTWCFNGLGSKGLLRAPLLARMLPQYLADPATLPDVLRARRA